MPRSRSPQPPDRGVGAEALSWALAVIGALCLMLTGAAMLLGTQPVVVRTGSMAPAFPIGTVALMRSEPAAHASVGDVVAVVRSDGRRIMHRVWRTRPAGGSATTLTLRGDRNRTADPPVTVDSVEQPIVVLPAVGRPLTWLGGRWVQYWLGVATGVIALAWIARRRDGRRRSSGEGPLRA